MLGATANGVLCLLAQILSQGICMSPAAAMRVHRLACRCQQLLGVLYLQERRTEQHLCSAVYNVTIGSSPSCSCPDAGKGNVCKHQLFVMLRVLHMDSKDPVIWQRGLLAEEVQHIWETSEQRSNSGALHTSVTANRALQAAYAASQADTAGSAAGSGAPSRPVAGDCPICYDDMQADKKAPSVRSLCLAAAGAADRAWQPAAVRKLGHAPRLAQADGAFVKAACLGRSITAPNAVTVRFCMIVS